MRKTVRSFCLSGLSAAVMLTLLGASCKAETPEKDQVATKLVEREAQAITVTNRATRVKIHVQRTQEKIWATPHYVSICSDDDCDGDEFQWEIVGGLRDGETLKIHGVDGYPSCFSNITIELPNDGAVSGPAHCEGAKYGTYWPYIITLTLPDGSTVTTDPGGIIHP